MENYLLKEYAKSMLGFSKKRFFLTLGLSVLVWVISALAQFLTMYNVRFSLFSSSSCQITGFPIAKCIYQSSDQLPFWIIDLANIFFWFWVIHIFSGFLFRSKKY